MDVLCLAGEVESTTWNCSVPDVLQRQLVVGGAQGGAQRQVAQVGGILRSARCLCSIEAPPQLLQPGHLPCMPCCGPWT